MLYRVLLYGVHLLLWNPIMRTTRSCPTVGGSDIPITALGLEDKSVLHAVGFRISETRAMMKAVVVTTTALNLETFAHIPYQ